MTLVEIMVTVSIATFVMLALGNSLMSLYQHQTSVMKKDVGNEFTASFSRVLHQNSACTQMLGGLPLRRNGAYQEIVIQDYLTSKKNEARQNPQADDLFAGQSIDEVLKVESLTMRNSSLADQTIKINGEDYIRRIAEIVLSLSISQLTENRDLKPRRFQLPVIVDSNNTIVRCAAELETEDACSAIGATYDPATNSCIPSTNCFIRGTFSRVQCTGALQTPASCTPEVLNQFTGATSCPSDAVESQTGETHLSYTENCGKKCT